MAEIIGTTASIVGLIGTAITLVQHIKKARASVEAESQIQTVEVEDQIKQIITVQEELQAFCHRLQTQQAKGAVHKYIYALKSGDEDDKELAQILNRLGNARSELHFRISVINVGLFGNLQDGFQVAWRTLEGTNSLLGQSLGVTLLLAERPRNRELETAGGDLVVLEASDIEALGLGSPNIRTAQTSADAKQPKTEERENLRWRNNKTGRKARIKVGNMGMDADVATPTANVSDNTFGEGLRMMVGHVGGESAASFNESFWKD